MRATRPTHIMQLDVMILFLFGGESNAVFSNLPPFHPFWIQIIPLAPSCQKPSVNVPPLM
jgi:hypothetical protein